jgi:hypothetical protein
MQKRLLDLIYLEKRPQVPGPGVGDKMVMSGGRGNGCLEGLTGMERGKSRIDKRCVVSGSEVVKRTNRTLLARHFFFGKREKNWQSCCRSKLMVVKILVSQFVNGGLE